MQNQTQNNDINNFPIKKPKTFDNKHKTTKTKTKNKKTSEKKENK